MQGIKNNISETPTISNNNFSIPKWGLKMQTPIERDTVSLSFKANKSNVAKKAIVDVNKQVDKAWEVNGLTAEKVIKRLEQSYEEFKTFLDNTFGDLVKTPKNKENIIFKMGARLKSKESTKEKTGTIKAISMEEIIDKMDDIIGGKIVLRSSKQKDVDSMLDRLIPLIKNGTIEILEIENKRNRNLKSLPIEEIEKYDYASVEKLEKIADIQDDIFRKNKKKSPVKRHLYDQYINYNGIHMTIKLNSKHPAKFELQILGKHVNIAKDVDDWLYKKLSGKEPKLTSERLNKTFKVFKDKNYFSEIGMSEKEYNEIIKNAQDKYKKYRAEVMLTQRKKPDTIQIDNRRKENFLPLVENIFPDEIVARYPELSYENFDFNTIAREVKAAESKMKALEDLKDKPRKEKENEEFIKELHDIRISRQKHSQRKKKTSKK